MYTEEKSSKNPNQNRISVWRKIAPDSDEKKIVLNAQIYKNGEVKDVSRDNESDMTKYVARAVWVMELHFWSNDKL